MLVTRTTTLWPNPDTTKETTLLHTTWKHNLKRSQWGRKSNFFLVNKESKHLRKPTNKLMPYPTEFSTNYHNLPTMLHHAFYTAVSKISNAKWQKKHVTTRVTSVNRIQSKINHKIGPLRSSEAFWAASHSVTRSTNSFSRRWIARFDAIAGNTTSLSNSRFLMPCAQTQQSHNIISTSQYRTDSIGRKTTIFVRLRQPSSAN